MKEKIIKQLKSPYFYLLLIVIIWFFGLWLYNIPANKDFIFPSSDDLAFHIRISQHLEEGDFSKQPGQIYFAGYSYLMTGAKFITGMSYTTISVIFAYLLMPIFWLLLLWLLIKEFGLKKIIWFSPLIVWFLKIQILNVWGGHFPYLIGLSLVVLSLILIKKRWASGIVLAVSILFHPLTFVIGIGMHILYFLFFDRTVKGLLARFCVPFIFSFPFLYKLYREILIFLGIKLKIIEQTKEFSESSDLGTGRVAVTLEDYSYYVGAGWVYSWIAVPYFFIVRKFKDNKIVVLAIFWAVITLIFSRLNLIVPERFTRDIAIGCLIVTIWMLGYVFVEKLKLNKAVLTIIFVLLLVGSTLQVYKSTAWATSPYVSQGEVQTMQWLSRQLTAEDTVAVDVTGRWLNIYTEAKIITVGPNTSESKFQDTDWLVENEIDYVYLGKKMDYWEPPGYVYTERSLFNHDYYELLINPDTISVYKINLK